MGDDMTTTTTARVTVLWRPLLAEFLGTGLLVAIVVGSGIMASRLSPNDLGLQLLENSLATALGLAVLILVLSPVSGAHFNPIVSIVDFVGRRSRRPSETIGYLAAQIAGAIAGAILANAMFGIPTAIATTDRVDGGTLAGEVVATAGLILLILGLTRTGRTTLIAACVGAYIGAAYWFTSSTSFANPAVTIGRIFSDTFAGIAPTSALPFIGAQLVGGALGLVTGSILFPRTSTRTEL
jgi:glycerol uptake facilitator-like aquaporin